MGTVLFGITGLILLLLVCFLLDRRLQKAFEEQFPQFQMQEFLARCTSGVNPGGSLEGEEDLCWRVYVWNMTASIRRAASPRTLELIRTYITIGVSRARYAQA